jgi:2-polyprenyl-3-methyl-5-hydroxy-6-metoxy-1,4-benzoquinol methylase
MTDQVATSRWKQAQVSEQSYWDVMNVAELLRICAEKPEFLNLFSEAALTELFADKAILEIGCGPLGIGLASFYKHKDKMKRYVKVEPLPRINIKDTCAATEEWATEFVSWVTSLSNEGEYIQKPGEDIDYQSQFDTVVTYNVLDHVNSPEQVIAAAYRTLRSGGKVLVGVDCMSFLGRIQFEHITRRIMRGSVLVEAHPHTFHPAHVLKMMIEGGFQDVQCIGVPSKLRQVIGSHFRPAFIGIKP